MRLLSVRRYAAATILGLNLLLAACASNTAVDRISLDQDAIASRGPVGHGSIVVPTPQMQHAPAPGLMGFHNPIPWYVDRNSHGPRAFGGYQSNVFEDIATYQRDHLSGDGRNTRDYSNYRTYRYRRVQGVR